MKEKGIDITSIIEITGLSEEEIKKLQNFNIFILIWKILPFVNTYYFQKIS